MKQKRDARIEALQKKVDQRKEEIAKVENPKFVTNTQFWFEGKFVQLQVTKDTAKLAAMFGNLLSQEKEFNKGAKALGLDVEFLYHSFTVSEWENDFKAAAQKLKLREMKNELAKFEKVLNDRLSEDAKADRDLNEIENALKD